MAQRKPRRKAAKTQARKRSGYRATSKAAPEHAGRSRGRPSKPLPDRIEASPEQIAQAMFKMPTDHQWRYSRGKEADSTEPSPESE